ncbi:MAG: 30S ribosomal protein S12 methylthiotransferase RimO, partial [Gammaproteobacteria bacterium]
VGFPGETEDDFEQLLDFLDEARLDRVGCFTYSPVAGAKANQLPDHVDEDTRQERLHRFMERQATISAQKLKQKIGTEQLVLVDAVSDAGAVARSTADAPEIDGLVYIEEPGELCPGEFIKVRIDDTDEHDMWGSIISQR